MLCRHWWIPTVLLKVRLHASLILPKIEGEHAVFIKATPQFSTYNLLEELVDFNLLQQFRGETQKHVHSMIV